MHRRFAALAATAALSSGLLTGTQAAQAVSDEDVVITVRSISIDDHVVRSSACRAITFHVEVEAPEHATVAGLTFQLRRGSQTIGPVRIFETYQRNRLMGHHYHCPQQEGVGTFSVRPTEARYRVPGNSAWQYASLTGQPAQTFTAKQNAQVHAISTRRSGNTVTVRARARYYDHQQRTLRAVTRSRLPASVRTDRLYTLQRRPISGGSWTTVERKAFPASGTLLTFTVRTSTRYQYRVQQAETPRTIAATSRTVRR